jgi:hypothetical protein
MNRFLILIVCILSLVSAAPAHAQQVVGDQCALDGSPQPGVWDGTDCVPDVECDPNDSSCVSNECNDPTIGSADCEQKLGPTGAGVQSGFKALVPIPGLTGNSDGSSTSVVDSKSLADFFNNLYLYAIGLAAVAAILQITYAGFRIAFNQDNVATAVEMKGRVASTLFGLVLVLSPVVVFSLINPAILNLELQLPPLDTAPLPPRTYGGEVTTGTDNSTGCIIFGKAGLLQIATCETETKAKQWASTCTGSVSALYTPDEVGAKSTIACSRYRGFVFINARNSLFVGTINEYQPLAIAKEEPNNGRDAMEFANICNRAGRATCLANTLAPGYIVCDPKPKTAVADSGTGNCFVEPLVCQPASIITTINTKCDTEPQWTIFE